MHINTLEIQLEQLQVMFETLVSSLVAMDEECIGSDIRSINVKIYNMRIGLQTLQVDTSDDITSDEDKICRVL